MDFNNSLRTQIATKADIVNVIGQYVKLEKKGNNYIGLCPFHDDKNPSMSVSLQKHVFKCFSCGVGGDVITFVSKIKNISISDAMREVGETVGIKVNLSQKDIEFQKNSKYYETLKEAMQFFKFYLHNTEDGTLGLEYLHNRKLPDEVIEMFNIGLTGEDDVLFKTLENKKIIPLDMIEVGLVRGGTQYHDVFKNRIMFPIEDLDGNVVGFSGRKFKKDDPSDSKYINTGETILFKKGNILYNYHRAIKEIKDHNVVYLYEGFMDVIASVRANVLNAVASMGTSLTLNQIKALKRLTNNIIVCYDSDGPGTIATIKAIHLLLQNDCNVSVVRIPSGKDPDEFITLYGNDKLHEVLTSNIVSSIDFLMEYERKNCSFANVNDIDIYKNKIFGYLRLFKSTLIIEKTLKKLAQELNVSFDNLFNDFNNQKYRVMETPVSANDNKKTKIIENKRFEISKNKYLKSERKLLKAAFLNQKQCLEIESTLNNYFYDVTNRNILYKLMNYYKLYDVMDKDAFINLELNNDEKIIMNDILLKEEVPNNDEIAQLIKNIQTWPYAKSINNMSNKANKTEEDLKNISDYKKKIIIIKK